MKYLQSFLKNTIKPPQKSTHTYPKAPAEPAELVLQVLMGLYGIQVAPSAVRNPADRLVQTLGLRWIDAGPRSGIDCEP